MNDTILHIWRQASEVQGAPQWWVTTLALALAVVLVAPRRVWLVSRNVVTIAHEGGHALAALATRRRLAGIRLHSDTSGVTVSEGRPTGPGMILTAYAGYVAPSLLGLGAAVLLAQGRVLATLWVATILLALMLLMIRNLYGALTVTLTGAAMFAISWWTPLAVQSGAASVLVWFLLIAGPVPVWELQSKRRQGLGENSDADQLADLTGIPGTFWVGTFFLINLACIGWALKVVLI